MGATTGAVRMLAVLWEWTEGEHAGARFWALHDAAADGLKTVAGDGRLRDWPSWGLRALGAAEVWVEEGVGLELLPPATRAPDRM